MIPSGEAEDVPLVVRTNLFEGQDSGIKQKKRMADRLPFKKKQALEVKYGPNRNVYLNDEGSNRTQAEELGYCSNVIVTSQYTLLSFLPLNMFEQFRKVANAYFLFVVILLLIPIISPFSPYGNIGALAFVIGVSAIRAAYEDIKRHRDDNTVNNTPAAVLQENGEFNEEIPWKDLKVGDIVRVDCNQFFPADLLLINSSEPNGLAFVNTMNLDGETNTKPKQAPSALHPFKTPMEISQLQGYVKSEGPNKNLDSYTGTLVLNGGSDTALDNRNILYRGCQLVTAKHIYGLVLFTGKQTKLMKNNIKLRLKRTKLDKLLNKAILLVFVMLFLVCMVGLLGMVFSMPSVNSAAYLQFQFSTAPAAILNFFTYLALFAGMVPISLYVSIEMVKVVQALLIDMDIRMYYEKNDTPAKAKTSALSEELGQISYIFSDKTGTLTRNEMEFKKCFVGGRSYGIMGDEANQIPPFERADPSFGFRDVNLARDLQGQNEQAARLQAFMRMLALCHTVLVEQDPAKGTFAYNAESPDEAALVEAAAQLGFRFVERVTNTQGSFLSLKEWRVGDAPQTYQLLNVIEFNSTRKRMSVVVRDAAGRIILFTKGADNIIKERLAPGQEAVVRETDVFLDQAAQIGLRTLLLGQRVLDPNWYAQWQAKYQAASTSIEDRAERVAEVAVELEKDLMLLGATAIEDKLQEGVPEAIANLAEAGIKIWVLTGDKKDTAINIGFSCKLLRPSYKLIVVDADDWHETQLQLKDALDRYIHGPDRDEQTFALVIEGKTLLHALEPENRLFLLAVATACKAVVCCRVSPKQKAEVVELVKKTLGETCLSIGDGANDVSMIREAHIGVGISGHEGRQAVMASDYAIAQFRFLEQLLLIHGRWSYKRITFLVKYSFYKNYIFNFVQLWFNMFALFSGQTMFDTWELAFFNLFFTSLPIMFYSVLERDVKRKTVRALPQLYQTGLRNEELNIASFLSWIARGIIESLVVFFVCYNVWEQDNVLRNGTNSGMWAMGVCAYSSVVVIVTLKLLLYMNTWTWHQIGIMLLSSLFWFGFILLYGVLIVNTNDNSLYYVAQNIMGSLSFWFAIGLATALCILPELAWLSIKRNFFPEDWEIARFLQSDTAKIRKIIEAKKPLPERYRKIKVLEMARSLEGIDPEVAYTGFAYSGTAGGRLTLALAQGIPDGSKAKF